MEDNKNTKAVPEATDEELDAAAGGRSRQTVSKTACLRCKKEFPSSSLMGGYCSSCLDELHKMGVYPPI